VDGAEAAGYDRSVRLWPVIFAIAGCGRIGFDTHGPSHLFAYVTDGFNQANTKTTVRIFAIDSAGELTETADSPFDLGTQPESIMTSPPGTNLYATSKATGSIYTLAIDADTGALSLLDIMPAGSAPEMIAFHPNGQWAYVADFGLAPRVYGYAVASDGTLSPLPGSPYIHGGGTTNWVEVHPGGQWAYALDAGSANVYPLEVMADGSLVALASPWSTGDSSPWALLFETNGRFGYVSPDLGGGIPSCTVDVATGALTTTPGSKFGSNANTSLSAAMDRARRRLYVANFGSLTLSVFAIDAGTGALAHVPGSPASIANTVWWVGVSPSTDDVYVTTTSTPAIAHLKASDAGVVHVGDFDVPGLDRAGRIAIAQTRP
jgi:6-phosphogluconolactonase (cycloisomerase 2 family)